MPKMISRRKRK